MSEVDVMDRRSAAGADDVDNVDGMRADIYALLAALLRRAPDCDLLAFVEAVEADAEPRSGIAGAWHALSEAAREADAEAVTDEYVALFIGIGQGEVTPFASWYHDGTLFGAPLVALRDELATLGLARAEAVREPEDHIGCLCEVMSHLITHGVERAQQAGFFRRHLADWAPRLFDDLSRAPSAKFYAAVAALGRAFLAIEHDFNQTTPSGREQASHTGGAT